MCLATGSSLVSLNLGTPKTIYTWHTIGTVIKEDREIVDCTKIKIYYKSTIIKWRGSSVG